MKDYIHFMSLDSGRKRLRLTDEHIAQSRTSVKAAIAYIDEPVYLIAQKIGVSGSSMHSYRAPTKKRIISPESAVKLSLLANVNPSARMITPSSLRPDLDWSSYDLTDTAWEIVEQMRLTGVARAWFK